MGVRVWDHWESLCKVPNRACAMMGLLEAGGVLPAAALGSLAKSRIGKKVSIG